MMKAPSVDLNQSHLFIQNLLSDIDQQPQWRAEAALCEGYYDGLQIKPEIAQAMELRGQPVIVNNLIAPTINGVLGMEAKHRTDWQVRADDDEGALVNEYLNERLNEAARMAKTDRACADGLASQAKAGLGWVEVRRNDDMFGDPYITQFVDWASVWYDFRSQNPDLSDARWLLVERWMDEDQAELISPKCKELARLSLNGWPVADPKWLENISPHLVNGFHVHKSTALTEEDYVDSGRKRVRFFDVYYRKFEIGQVLVHGQQKILFDKTNKLHLGLVNSGAVTVKTGRFARMYRALYLGPHLIHNGPSPYPHNEFPLVPFFGFREARSRVPYGLIRSMVGPQDEVNFRRSMLTWLLKARRIIMDSDATEMSDVELANAVARVDGIIKLDPKRKNLNASAFSIQSEINIAAQQFSVMQDAEQQIQQVAGIYNAMLGQDSTAKSGVAIRSLVDQGSMTLAEFNDNFRFGKAQVGNLLMQLVAEDIGNEQKTVKVYASNPGRKTEELTLNQQSETGEVSNRVSMLNRRVVLSDITASPGYRAQMLERLMALAGTMPDNIKALMLPDILDLAELPRKHELIRKIEQAIGMNTNPEQMSEEQRAQLQMQQQQQQMALAVEMALKESEIRTRNATAAKAEAEAEKVKVDTGFLQVKTLSEQENAGLLAAKAKEIMARIRQQDSRLDIDQRRQANDIGQSIDQMIEKLAMAAQPQRSGQAA